MLIGELTVCLHDKGTCRDVYGGVLSCSSAGDVSSDAGDGTADCAHLVFAPLDVDLHMFWRTTSTFMRGPVGFGVLRHDRHLAE